ncbi:hypothetical protein MLD38_028751 [Melastoma candidum]|uniref:Uncharacterized protein n=1 Tax=Melastoma candidum TaxID=119954 RepID=A0ACB9N1N3_9MYRT|nr:hypothetical protein MLD38_028751 [Melastoma candidum]
MSGSLPPPTATDMTGICSRDQLWLNSYPIDDNLVFDYFALSPFSDWSCNNEQLRLRSVHRLDSSQLTKMTGIEYMLSEFMDPLLFVIRKQKRDGPDKVIRMLRGGHFIMHQRLLQWLPQSWKRLDMMMLKMRIRQQI